MTSPPAADDARAPAPVARAIARLALRWPKAVVLTGLAVMVVGGALASRLSLETDLSELLPRDAPSVVALKALNRRVGGTGNVAIALDGDVASLRRYMPKLVEALRRDLGPDLLSIKYQRKDVDDYFRRFGAWSVPLSQLEAWRDELQDYVARRANPMIVDLADDPPAKPGAPSTATAPAGDGGSEFHRVAEEIRAARRKMLPTNEADPETGLLIRPDAHVGVVFVRPAANSLHLAGSEGMLRRIADVTTGTRPESFGVRVAGYTGSIPSALSEVDTVARDIGGTALLVVLLVGGVVVLYFRSARPLLLLGGALAIGAAVAMGFAELWIGHVNAQTAFLGSIIVGTGINYGIIFLDRYHQLRRAHVPPGAGPPDAARFGEVIARATDETLRATWIAALATAVSFGVLAAGEVESFHQFGWIGGIGILACWLATFTVVPASVVLSDRRRSPRPRPRFEVLPPLFRVVARGCERAPWLVVALVAVGTAGSVAAAWRGRGAIIETDMSRLGNKTSTTSGIVKVDRQVRPMDDRSSTPAVIATDSRADTEGVCEVLTARGHADLGDVLTRCYSINDLLPSDVERRRPLMEKLRRDLARISPADLAPEDRVEYDDLLRALAEPPPTDADLPPTLKEPFVERDGSVGKLAFVDPRNEHIEANLYRFSDAIREIRLPSGKVITSSGETVVFADVLRALRRDTKRLTIAAAVLVLLVLALVTRRLGTFLRVGGALVLGVVLMIGLAFALQEKLNFFNFVALPTTFGIGIDYAINVEERLRRRGRARLVEAVGEIGPAVLLSSLTSILGYASLLTARNRALSSFGELAILGEGACVLVAVALVPALWALWPPRAEPPPPP